MTELSRHYQSRLSRLCLMLLAGATAFILGGCSGEDNIAPSTNAPVFIPKVHQTAPKEKKETPRYVYRGDRFRDPFIPLNGTGMVNIGNPDEPTAIDIGSLSLKGIMSDGKEKAAVINGGGITYILRGSRLFDNRNRPVKGITGIIKKESVLMISPDKTTKELTLRQKEVSR